MSYPWLASGFLLCSAVMLGWILATRRAFPGRFRTVRGVSGALICLANAFILGLDEALPTFLAGPGSGRLPFILGVATGVVGWQLGRAEAAVSSSPRTPCRCRATSSRIAPSGAARRARWLLA